MSPAKGTPALLPEVEYRPSNKPQPATDETSKRLLDDARPSIVRIQTEKGTGSGFFMDNKGTIGTAAHVIDGTKEHFAVTSTGKTLRLRLKSVDELNDIAVLVPSNPFPSKPLPLAEAGSSLRAGDPVFAIGHPLGDRKAFVSPGTYTGVGTHLDCLKLMGTANAVQARLNSENNADRIYTYNRPLLGMHIHTEHGNSGGPVLNKDGKVVAMTDLGWGTKNFNTPIEKITALSNAPARFDFQYERRPSELIYKYEQLWKEKPLAAVGITSAAAGLGYGSYRALDAYTGGAALPLAGGATMLAIDTRKFISATDSASRWKYGLSAACDLGLATGGAIMLFSDSQTGGLTTVGVSALGRVATEFIPNRVVQTRATKIADNSAAVSLLSYYPYR